MAQTLPKLPIELPMEALTAFCKKWKVRELALFGSILREDFRPDSDVDIMVSFQVDARIGLWELTEMRGDLVKIFGREVDLVEKEALSNPFRRAEILRTHRVVYAA